MFKIVREGSPKRSINHVFQGLLGCGSVYYYYYQTLQQHTGRKYSRQIN